MFNWKRYAGFSLICARKCRLSHSFSKLSPPVSRFSPFPSHFSLSSSLLSLEKLQSLFSLFAYRSPSPPFRSLRFSPSDLPSLPVCLPVVLLPLSTQPWFDAALLSLVCARALSCTHVYWSAIMSVFCVNLTQVKAVMNSTNQFPPVSCTGRTRLKTRACVPLQGPTDRELGLIYYSSNSVPPLLPKK